MFGDDILPKLGDILNELTTFSSEDFLKLVKQTSDIIKNEYNENSSLRRTGNLLFIPSSGEAIIIGDIHGDLESLIHIIKDSDFIKKAQKKQNVFLIFLGDYGDRGPSSPETYYLILKLKKLFPEKVILMRGNHEAPKDLLPIPYELPLQLEKYGSNGKRIFSELVNLFDYFLSIVIIEQRFVLIHGCFPTQALTMEDLAYAHEKHPKQSHLEEMLWNDPKEGCNNSYYSPRGIGRLTGIPVTEKFLKLLSVKVLIRGHECCEKGFKINHNSKILTIFSTNHPPYNNKYGAYLKIDLSKEIENAEDLKKNIIQFT